MVELLRKSFPYTVNVNEPPPGGAVFGLMPVNVGTGLLAALTRKISEPLGPPPGAGLNTEIGAVPVLVTYVLGTEAVNCVELTYVVASAIPFHLITEPETKLLPLAVIVKPAEPATAVVGEIEFNIGTGLLVLPPPPPVESDLLHEMNNDRKSRDDSILVMVINWLFMPV